MSSPRRITAGRPSSGIERRARLRKGGHEVTHPPSASGTHASVRAAVLSLLAISVGAVLWAGGATASSEAEATTVLRIGITGAPDTFDPTLMGDNRSIELAQNVFEGVLDVDNRARIIPGVAKSWTVSKNKLVYTFHLRKGVRFQDGSPLTADDYVYTINRSLDPKVGSGTSFFLEPIKGATDVLKGKTKRAAGLKALDPLTLQVTLASPAGFFPATISRWSAWAVNEQVISKFGADWVKPPNNVGSGAYRLVDQSGDQRYVFEANPTYRQGKPRIDRVEVSVVSNSTAALARYEAGELDIVVNLGVASVLKVRSDSKLRSQFHTRPIMRTVWLAMRNDKPPFNNKKVRQAFNLAIDKPALVRIALAGEATVANSWLPPGLAGNIVQQTRKSTLNVDRARKLLAEAGYPGGEGFPAIDLTHSINIGLYPEVFQLVQAQLERNLGVKVGLKQLPPRAFGELIGDAARRPALFGYTFGFDYPDAQELTQYLGMSTAPFNVDGYKNARYDKAVAKANVSGNQRERAALYALSERIRVADAASVPLYFVHNNWLVKPYVKGFGFGPLYMTKWREASTTK
jgi:oligopeptide transport system substrate-binding protein